MNPFFKRLMFGLVLLSSPLLRAGSDSFALQFDGVGDVVTAPDTTDLNSGQLTVTTWIKTSMTNGFAGVIMKYGADENNGWQLFLANGFIRAWYYGNKGGFIGGVDGISAGQVADGQWHHIALVVNERGGRIQVDGDTRATGSWEGTPGAAVNGGDLILGTGVFVGLFRGTLDEVTVWDRALTESEIIAMKGSSLSGREEDLRYYFRLSEGQGARAENSRIGKESADGSLTGSQTWVPGVLLGPAVVTQAADAITSQSARLKSEVSSGGTNTMAWFEWGTSTNYDHVTAALTVGSRDQAVPFAVSIGGLMPDVPVHFRGVASNALGVAYGTDKIAVPPVSSMNQERYSHTATLLPNGKVLVAGGYGVPLNNIGFPTNTAELFDPATGRWSPTGRMHRSHGLHTATLMLNGQVLVLDVFGAELYDPATGEWSLTGQPSSPHNLHTATLLPDGRVLVAGGLGNHPEIYHPATGKWTSTGVLHRERTAHTATLLPNGVVLIAGGVDTDQNALNISELFDPTSGQWALTGAMNGARSLHTATLQVNGQVLAVGGTDGFGILRTAERYDPDTGLWSPVTGRMTERRYYHTAALLPNGLVLVMGGEIDSRGTVEFIEPNGQVWQPGISLATQRFNSSATLLASGQILLAGGWDRDGIASGDVEIYTPHFPGWSVAPPMARDHNGHTASLLPDGRVLVAGFGDTELFHVVKNLWTNAPALNIPRASHTATLLPNGQVLVAGGYDATFGAIRSAELFHPATDTWTETGALSTNRYAHTATLLRDGQVLVAGGVTALLGGAVDTAELFNPATGTWTNAEPMPSKRSGHTATLLPNGKVLVAGGGPENFTVTETADLFDPVTGKWTPTSPMTSKRAGHRAVPLPNGTVLVAGGVEGAFLSGTKTAEIYDPATGSWSPTTSMSVGRASASATLLPDGRVLVAGGVGQGYLDSGEVYDPSTRTWLFSITMDTATANHTATLLPNGKVLVAGGFTGQRDTPRAEFFHAEHGSVPEWQPQITQYNSPLSPGDSLRLTALRLRGLSSASFGGSKESASDVPVVQLRSLESGQMIHLLSTYWSASNYTSLPLPDFPLGWAMVTVVVNGIAGPAELVEIRSPETPGLIIERVSPSSLRVRWPSPSTGFELQERSVLSPAVWAPVSQVVNDDGRTRSVQLSPVTGSRFYRLAKP